MKEGKDFIFGLRPVIEAIKSGKEIERLLIQSGLKGALSGELMGLIKEFGIPFQYVPIDKLNRLTFKNHQGLICFISPITYYTIEQVLPSVFERGESPLIVLLDRITDVRNFGAIARAAECAGAHAIVISTHGAAAVNADAVKTSAGALHKIPVCRTDKILSTIDYLKECGLQVVSCLETGKQIYYEADLSLPTVIVVGSEESGISAEILRKSDVLVKIPVFGEIASLNVSVALGVVIYEAVRQRSLN